MKEDELLAIIRKLQTLQQEWKMVDAKRELILQENGDKAEFVKDVIAMANNGEQSYLIIGLEDKTFTSVGHLNCHYNKNDLNQILFDKIDPIVVVGYQVYMIEGYEYAVVEIMGHNPPYIVARDLIHNRQDRKQTRIYKGTIFVRHEDRTEGVSRSELDAFFTNELKREFENESKQALQLALNQPKYWEYLLTAELLQTKTERIRRALADLDRGLIYKRTTQMNGSAFLNWASARCADLSALITLFLVAINEELPVSWGKSGTLGNAMAIKRFVDMVISGCNQLLEWETDLRSVNPPGPFMALKQMMAGWTLQIFKQIDDMAAKMLEPFQQPDPKGQYVIEVVFTPPPNVDKVTAEIKRLKNHPEEWIESYL